MAGGTYRHTEIAPDITRLLTQAKIAQQNLRGVYGFLQAQAHRSDYGGLFGIDDLINLEDLKTPISADYNFFDLTDMACLFGEEMNGYGRTFSIRLYSEYQRLNREYSLEWKLDYVFDIIGSVHGVLYEIARMGGGQFASWEYFDHFYTPRNNGLMAVERELANLPKTAAKGIGRMRQILTQIQEDPRWEEYYEIEDQIDAHMDGCDICAEEPGECDEYLALCEPQDAIYDAIMADWQAGNYRYGSEFASTMLDPYSYRSFYDYPDSRTAFSNPLVLDRMTRFGAKVYLKNGGTQSVYAVRLVRKYALVGSGQNFDYNESGFSAGNPNFTKSNIFTWLNSPAIGALRAWQVAAHSTDTFRYGGVYWGYLECIENNLRLLLSATMEQNEHISSYTTKTSAYDYAPVYATILSARDYALSSTGKVNGWYLLNPETNSMTSTGYYGTAKKINLAPVGTYEADTAPYLMTKSILNNTTTTSMRYLYYAAKLTATSTGFTNCQPNTANMAVQPAHNIIPFHLDESIGADPQYLKPPKLTTV